MGSSAVEFQNVSYSYPQGIVLEDISLKIPRNEISCLVGPNGGGKSTFLKLILGLLSPQKGKVSVYGEPPKKKRLEMGYMPQQADFDPLYPITVGEIVQMGRIKGNRLGFLSKQDKAMAEASLDEVGLLELKKENFHSLSGGLKQRVLIARALAVNPRLLLLDEPTAMVDAKIEAHLLAQIKELHQRMTILLVSHDANFVSSLVDRVFCVNKTVVEHSIKNVSDQSILELYGESVKKVSHDHVEGHSHHE